MSKCEIGDCQRSRYRTRQMTLTVEGFESGQERTVKLCKMHFKQFNEKERIPIHGFNSGERVDATLTIRKT